MQSNLGRDWIFWVWALALLLSCSHVQADASPLPLDGSTSSVDLRPYTEFFVENGTDRPISLEDLQNFNHPSYSNTFKKGGSNFSFGYTKAPHWFRWRLNANAAAEGEWWLQIAPTFLDSVDLFIPQADGSYQKVSLGDHVAQSARPLMSRHFLAPINVAPINLAPIDLAPVNQAAGQDNYYYLRVETTSTVTLGITLWRPEAYANSLAIENLLYGLLFGLMLAAMVISLISGLWIRQPFYFVMATFLFCNGLLHFTLNGYDQLFYGSGGNWPDRMVGFSVFAAGAAGLSLCLVFLESLKFYPRFSKTLWAIVGLSGIGAFVSILGAPMPAISGVGATVVLLLTFILTFVMLRKSFIPALLMLILFVPGFFTLLFQIARNFSLLPLNFWTTHVWALMTIFQIPYIALVVMLHLRAQEKAFLTERQKARLHRDLFSMVAHELRTPLAIVGSALTNIELQTQAAHPELAPRFSRANLGLARLNTLIDNALAEDRLLDKGIQLQREWITAKQLIEQVRELRPIAPPHYLHVSLNDDAFQLFVDPQWLSMAILNLLDNAIKYSPGGGHIRLHVEQDEQMTNIHVIDQGIGIPPGAADRIFEKFFRADNAAKLKGSSGIGVGLFLVQTVVALHGGQTAYTPNLSGGSIFIVRLPVMKK
jgi:signal transduction histidine kinase